MTELEPEIHEEQEDLTNAHVLQNKYTFWFRYDSGKGSTNASNYNQSIKRILDFQSVERFWNIYDHLKRPSDFKEVKAVEFHLFKDGINPFWEDPNNKNGGKWMIRLRKGIAARYWEDILFAIIGEQFDVGNEVCGAVLSVRATEDIISVWNRSADNIEAINKIRDTIRRVVRLPDLIPMEYKRHSDSLTDKSSYRNPTMVFRGTARPGGYNPGSAGGGRGQSNWKGNTNNSRWSGNNNNSGNNNEEGGPSGGGRSGYNNNRNNNNNSSDQQGGGGWRSRRSDGDEGADTNGGGTGGGQRYNRYDRNSGGDQTQGQHRQRGDREGGYNNNNRDNNNDRERGDHQHRSSNRSSDQTSANNASADATPAERPSNAYTAGGGSFASRVKGNNVVEAPPTLTAPTHPPSRSAAGASNNESGANAGGAGWHRVNNPFTKN